MYDAYVRDAYRDIFYDSILFCQNKKGLEVYAYCLYDKSYTHDNWKKWIHDLSDIIRDLKSFTSRHTRSPLKNNIQESRKEWMMEMMKNTGFKNDRNKDFKFWLQDNHPVELSSNKMMEQRLDYIHYNPVEAGFVDDPCAWLHSSAGDYSGVRKGREFIY